MSLALTHRPRNARLLPLLVLPLVLGLFAAGCNVIPTGRVIPRFGNLEPDGSIKIKNKGDNFKSRASLDDIADDENVFQPRADLKWLGWHLSVTGFDTEFSGDGTLDREIRLGNGTIGAGTPVRGEVDVGLYTSSLTFDFFPGDWLELGVGAGLGYAEADVSIVSKTTGVKVRADGDLPFGYAALRAGVQLGDFGASALLNALSVDFDDDDLAYVDLDIEANYRLIDFGLVEGYVLAGYRYIDIDYEYDDRNGNFDLDVSFDGPYLGVMIGF